MQMPQSSFIPVAFDHAAAKSHEDQAFAKLVISVFRSFLHENLHVGTYSHGTEIFLFYMEKIE